MQPGRIAGRQEVGRGGAGRGRAGEGGRGDKMQATVICLNKQGGEGARGAAHWWRAGGAHARVTGKKRQVEMEESVAATGWSSAAAAGRAACPAGAVQTAAAPSVHPYIMLGCPRAGPAAEWTELPGRASLARGWRTGDSPARRLSPGTGRPADLTAARAAPARSLPAQQQQE